ncbi:peptidoglycan editing factor PgeF [Actinomadura sp. WAC 06369]|uniref:peptidoglycan editing factor PgeF n=1 Tax=Actinomadura sp. WAC 06369 TaxID=2203193 RepID=UPI000F792EE4|nr:peptidoglycan editing factor PgeF [Actinomadura sp. WAC 06369]RSN48259.1 peptidoglycan editing factor PgeF [Actinomadura sp. WAC 06369]
MHGDTAPDGSGSAAFALGDGVRAAFTGRAGGVSEAPFDSLNLGGAVGDDPAAVRGNRKRAAARLGVDPARTVWMRQVHGADVAYVTAPEDLADTPVDAIVTTVPGLALAVLVADCAPVLLADPAAGVVGAAHSGRPGTAAGVVPALLDRMREHGADPSRTAAAIGPAACGGCYEVPAAMRDEVAAAVPAARATTSRGTPGLDIRAGIAAQLAAAGVTDVRTDPRCTIEDPDLFSYRRDGRTGRFAGYVWLTEREERPQ